MNGIKPKPFEMWVKRRRMDVAKWALAHEIKTLDDLRQVCLKRNLAFPVSPDILALFAGGATSPIPESVIPEPTTREALPLRKTSNTKSNSKKETWHVPAAERPLRKTKTKNKKGKKS